MPTKSRDAEYTAALTRAQEHGVRVIGTGHLLTGERCWLTTSSGGAAHHLVVERSAELQCDCELARHKPHALCTHRAVVHHAVVAQRQPPSPRHASAPPAQPKRPFSHWK